MTDRGMTYSAHEGWPEALAPAVDRGLDAFNAAAAPLHEVVPISCFALARDGAVAGGALGRLWGPACELQQLWVDTPWRGGGIGRRIVDTFEQLAAARGARTVYVETFSFQAPAFYARCGYHVVHERRDYPHGIAKLHLVKQLASPRESA
jgi:GNAT superfamily N-acetyltransferase